MPPKMRLLHVAAILVLVIGCAPVEKSQIIDQQLGREGGTSSTVDIPLTIESFLPPSTPCFNTAREGLQQENLQIVPTFHSLGIYWQPNGGSPNIEAYVLFRERSSTDEFHRSLNFIYSTDDGEYRGSVVHLRPDTEYDITLMLDGFEQEIVTVETWCEQFPVAETRFIPTGLQNEPFVISGVVGSPDGYIVYTADPNGSSILDGDNWVDNLIIEDSSYIIVRGLTFKNAREFPIHMRGFGSTHDIVIEDNIIENWGEGKSSGFGGNDQAIRTADGQGTNFKRLVIQRNIIRNPRWDTNSWDEFRSDSCTNTPCHPTGPGGIFLRQTAGNHVIRYNEIYSTNGNYFNDGIGGDINNSRIGNVNRDTDIYGNGLSHIWDDAIEVEGGDRNIRIWGNYIDKTFTAIALSPVSRGPVYVFRNVVYRTQKGPGHNLSSGIFIKANGKPDAGSGDVFIFHNTTYRDNGGGIRYGIQSWNTFIGPWTSRNNIIDASSDSFSASASSSDFVDFDYDLYQGDIRRITGQEQNGIVAPAVYDNPDQDFALALGAWGHDDGIVIPNFSFNAVDMPDMGAQEYGAPLLEFGVLAYEVIHSH